jgi:hypothetical protein
MPAVEAWRQAVAAGARLEQLELYCIVLQEQLQLELSAVPL